MNKNQTNIVISHFIGQTRRMTKGIYDRLALLKDPDYAPVIDAIDGAISELDDSLEKIEAMIKRDQKGDDENYASFSEFVKGL